jgi:hypothetical protein
MARADSWHGRCGYRFVVRVDPFRSGRFRGAQADLRETAREIPWRHGIPRRAARTARTKKTGHTWRPVGTTDGGDPA